MKKWNIVFTLRGPGGTMECPNTANPVEAPTMFGLLQELALQLPKYSQLGIEVVGVKVDLVDREAEVKQRLDRELGDDSAQQDDY